MITKRRIVGFILIIIALPLIYFSVLTFWQIFSTNKDLTPKDVSVSEMSRSSAVISWEGPQGVNSTIEYGDSQSAMNLYAPATASQTTYKSELTLLTSSTTYYFQIRVGEDVFDNGGVPWTFTTKDENGNDAKTEVQGIQTRIQKALDERDLANATPTPQLVCPPSATCIEIRNLLNRGCSTADYVRCLNNPTATPSGTLANAGYIPASTSTPTPTPVIIKSAECALNDPVFDSCTKVSWRSMNWNPDYCQKAFSKYQLECRNQSFSTSTSGDVIVYYNDAITSISAASVTLPGSNYPSPASGATVYCQLRATDGGVGDSHATDWVRASKKCS